MQNYTPTRFAIEVAARLRGLIARYDISQGTLAVLCGVSQSQFSKIIRGTRPRSVDHFAAICSALEIDAEALVSDVEAFLDGRAGTSASPVLYVEGGERLPVPRLLETDQLDGWAIAAATRLMADADDVVGEVETARAEGRKSTYGAAADARRDRTEGEFEDGDAGDGI